MQFEGRLACTLLATAMVASAAHAAKPFHDVPRDHWAFEEVHWLRADGMLEGWGNEFHGDQNFTRYEMSEVLSRYMRKYYAERDKVQGKLQSLQAVDTEHRSQINELYNRTRSLETRVQSVDGKVVDLARRPAPEPPPPVIYEPPAEPEPTALASEFERTMQPEEPAAGPGPAAAEPTRELTLAERVARLRARVEARQDDAAAPPPPVEIAPRPPSEEPSGYPASVEGAGSTGGGESAAAPEGGRQLTGEEADRLAAIRERYRRIMEARRSMVSSSMSEGSGDGRALPGADTSLAGSQPLPGGGSQPLPSEDSQPLPALGYETTPSSGI